MASQLDLAAAAFPLTVVDSVIVTRVAHASRHDVCLSPEGADSPEVPASGALHSPFRRFLVRDDANASSVMGIRRNVHVTYACHVGPSTGATY